jgi:hypothetical protein
MSRASKSLRLMEEREIIPPPEGKMEELGHVILQSRPVTKAEGDAWLKFIAGVLPAEIFVAYSWVPLQGYAALPPEDAN